MNKVSVKFNGETITKDTKRTGVTHVVVSLHKGKRVISGMYSSKLNADKGLAGYGNPAWAENVIVAVIDDVESGLTGEDWFPTSETRCYAQKGEIYAFGKTEEEARAKLLA